MELRTTSSTTVCSPLKDRSLLVLKVITGIDLSYLADLPTDVVNEGRRVAENLSHLQEKDQEKSRTHLISQRRKALLKVYVSTCDYLIGALTSIYQLRADLLQALRVSTLPDEELVEYLAQLQRNFAGTMSSTL
jgi:DNA mismatch repair protein MSH4